MFTISTHESCDYKLKFVFNSDDLDPKLMLINKQNGSATFFSHLNSFFIYFTEDKEYEITPKIIKSGIINFLKNNKLPTKIDILINNLVSKTNFSSSKVIEIITETILFESHKKISFKRVDINNWSNYNFNFVVDEKDIKILNQTIQKTTIVINNLN
jgi:hypothetical protein